MHESRLLCVFTVEWTKVEKDEEAASEEPIEMAVIGENEENRCDEWMVGNVMATATDWTWWSQRKKIPRRFQEDSKKIPRRFREDSNQIPIMRADRRAWHFWTGSKKE